MIRCLLYVSPDATTALQTIGQRIYRFLDRPDMVILSNLDRTPVVTTSEMPSVEQMDILILEGTTNDADVGFLLAHAIARRKPTLYLYERGTVARVLSHLALHELPSWIHVVSYHDGSLERHIEDFLTAASGRTIKPAPRIKFTLRITSPIESYLQFKTLNTKTSKADWVREQIEGMMEHDEDWRRYLKRQRSAD